MNLTNFWSGFFPETLRTELAAAVSAGLAAAAVTLFFRLLRQPVPIEVYVKYFVFGIASYALAASVLHEFWTGWPSRIAPKWLLMALLGSLIFLALRLSPGIIQGWLNPLESQPLREYILTELTAASSVFMVLTLVTVPVAGAVYYSFSIVRAFRVRRTDRKARPKV